MLARTPPFQVTTGTAVVRNLVETLAGSTEVESDHQRVAGGLGGGDGVVVGSGHRVVLRLEAAPDRGVAGAQRARCADDEQRGNRRGRADGDGDVVSGRCGTVADRQPERVGAGGREHCAGLRVDGFVIETDGPVSCDHAYVSGLGALSGSDEPVPFNVTDAPETTV